MKRKKLFITLIALFSFAVCLGTFLIIWFWGDQYDDFKDFVEAAPVPGLDEGAVPQGLCNYTTHIYDETGAKKDELQEYYFISAYMKKGPSRIYVTGSKTGYVGYVTLQNPDGSDFTGHCGGIATSSCMDYTSGTLWIASEGKVYCAKKNSDSYTNVAEELIGRAGLYASPDENGQPQNVIKFKSSFEANCNADFCFYFDYDGDPTTYSSASDKLYVGEFYRPKSSETDARHRVTTKNGSENKAFVYEYTIDGSNLTYGLRTISADNVSGEMRVPKIQYVYSIPEKIQGFARIPDESSKSSTKGKLVLSQSWGLSNSTLYYFDWEKIRTNNSASYGSLVKNPDGSAAGLEYKGVFTQNGAKYYENPTVYFVDESSLEREYSIPSMSEGLCANGNKVFVLFESASYKYRTFVRQQLDNLYYFIPRR